MKLLREKRIARRVVTFLALIAASFAFASFTPVGAANHGQLVGETPRRNVPVVLDGEVRAHALIGDRVFVGGNFQQVRRPDGTTITQPNIFAYNINTGDLDENFRPDVNNAVWALEVNPGGDALYVAGRFVQWDGEFAVRVAKLDAFGNRDTGFVTSASAIVRDLAVTNDDVYLAGDFTVVSGEVRNGFAAVDANTGAVDQGFIMDVEDSAAGTQLGRGIVVTRDGNSVFGLHFGSRINGVAREVLVKINTAGNTAQLANWRVDWSGQTRFQDCRDVMRDIAISPDDTFIVVAGQGSDNPPNCDSVLRYPTNGTGVINFDWSARMYSSVFSLAVSDTAVYVGGHFCGAPLNGAVAPSFQTHERVAGDAEGTANQCNFSGVFDPENVNPHEMFPNHAVFRRQIAALDSSDGRALAWEPGSNALLGVLDLTVIDRGLLAGSDLDRYNQILTGRSGFFDLGGFTPPPPGPAVASCEVAVNGSNVPVVSFSDFPNVNTVSIVRNGGFIDTVSQGGTGTYSDFSAEPGVAYSYVVRSRPGGVVTDVACTPETITVTDEQLCNGLVVTVDLSLGQTPGPGDDVILGTPGADRIYGQRGDDTICALGGDDLINAGGDNDWVDGGPGNDEILGIGGNDIIFGDSGDDVIFGGSGDDEIEGEGGNDTLFGQGGDDTIDGGDGVDGINGGGGRDTIFTGTGATVGTGVFVSGSFGNDTINGGPDADDIRGSTGSDIINGFGGDDKITGGVGRDVISGGDGDDNISGQDSRDTISGDAGNDIINGGLENDTINGGDGDDVLNGSSGNDVVRGDSGSDTVIGGGGDDTLVGGPSSGDVCNGQSGTDTADGSCESVIGVP